MISREEIQNCNSQVKMQIHLWIPGEPSALALMLLFRVAAVFFVFFLLAFRFLLPPIEASHVYSAPRHGKLHLLQKPSNDYTASTAWHTGRAAT